MIMELLKKYLLVTCLAAMATFTVHAQQGNHPVGKQTAPFPVINTDSLARPWQWRQYLQTVSDSANGRSVIYGAYPSHQQYPAIPNWEATPPFRWNDIASITAMALLGYFMSR